MSKFKIEFEETIEGDFLYLWRPIVNGYKESPCINGEAEATAYFKDYFKD